MTTPIVAIDPVLSRLGVDAEDPAVPRINGLLLAVSSEMRRLARRAFEGTPTIYRETYEPQERTLVLPHVPVTDVLWVRPLQWDWTASDIWDPLDVVGGVATTLAAAAAVGATNIKLDQVTGLNIGDHLRLGSSTTREVVRITAVGTAGAGGTGLTVEPALAAVRASGEAVRVVAGSTAWRLMDASRGRLELAYRRSLVEVLYRVSGEIPEHVREAALDWIEVRWNETPGRRAGLTGYSTGTDSETYGALAGTPPRDVLRALGLERHLKGAVI